MEQKLAVIIVHGMGNQHRDYAETFVRLLKNSYVEVAEVASPDLHLAIEPVFWADVFEGREKVLFDSIVSPYGLHYEELRKFVIHYMADAIAYQPVDSKQQNYDAVHATISQTLHLLSAAVGQNAPLCVISHSLGTVIASNFFYDRQYHPTRNSLPSDASSPLERGETLTLFYSFGTTLPLWSLRYRDFDKPIQVPIDGIRAMYPGIDGEWINFYDKDDVLAYPLRGVNPAYEKAVREDFEVHVGDWKTGWNPFCHRGYMTSPDVARRIAIGLSRIWTKINLTSR